MAVERADGGSRIWYDIAVTVNLQSGKASSGSYAAKQQEALVTNWVAMLKAKGDFDVQHLSVVGRMALKEAELRQPGHQQALLEHTLNGLFDLAKGQGNRRESWVSREHMTMRILLTDDEILASNWVINTYALLLSGGAVEEADRPILRTIEKTREGKYVLPEERRLRKTIRSILAQIPVEFSERRSRLAIMSDAYREEIAHGLQSAMNTKLQKLPQKSYDEKRELAIWANGVLRPFGLAFKCPKTGRPSMLHVHPGRHPERGRFQLENVDDDGRFVRPFSSNDLPELELMPDDLTRAQRSRWAGRVRSEEKSRSRT